ncbi:SRPBCC domain-containing protein [Lysobacter koreensis]|uniref:SRPBCC domain-containing protein n=1 Tax=Lysobacter koreensis TaxID=266122 RepID=A0ABW2YP50_9GAMM
MPTSIHQEIAIAASPDRVYAALLDAAQFSAMSGGAPTEIDGRAGGAFSCFGGMITGRNVELVADRRIVQAWRVGNWPEGVYSIARFELAPRGAETQLVFDHTGFPEDAREHLANGWHANYWEPLRRALG